MERRSPLSISNLTSSTRTPYQRANLVTITARTGRIGTSCSDAQRRIGSVSRSRTISSILRRRGRDSRGSADRRERNDDLKNDLRRELVDFVRTHRARTVDMSAGSLNHEEFDTWASVTSVRISRNRRRLTALRTILGEESLGGVADVDISTGYFNLPDR